MDMQFPSTLNSLKLNLHVRDLPELLAMTMPQQFNSLSLKLHGTASFTPERDLKWPRNLTSLSLPNLGDGVSLGGLRLPETLTSLSLASPDLPSSKAAWKLPQSITALSVNAHFVETQMANWKFPNNITSVSLSLFPSNPLGLSDIQWPASMTQLSLELDSEVEGLGDLNQLKKLTSLELDIGSKLLPEVAKLNLKDITTLWVGTEGTEIPDLPSGFKFLGIRV
jgi:hypothetical protein